MTLVHGLGWPSKTEPKENSFIHLIHVNLSLSVTLVGLGLDLGIPSLRGFQLLFGWPRALGSTFP